MSEIRVDTISEKTSANGVAIDGVTIKDGGIAATDGSTITTADNTDTLTLISTDADANVGPVLNLYRNSSSPADDDDAGRIHFTGNDSGGNATTYATIRTVITDVTDGTEDVQVLHQQVIAGTNVNTMRIKPDEIVFNDSSIDLDFRVESNGNANMLFVNGGTDKVGIGTNAPAELLEVEGTGAAIQIDSNGDSALRFATSGTVKHSIFSSSGDLNFFDNTNSATRMKIDATGAVTMPLQPAFLASPAAQQSNLTNSTTLLFGTEVTDRNADYNAGTGTFTAPVTGLYQVGFSIRLQEVPINATYVMVETVSSNRSFYYILDPGSFDENAAYWEFNGNYLIDMDANDTYFIRYIQSGGTTSTDMSTASYSFGTLAC